MTEEKRSVLIVDDERSIRVTLKMLIEEAGYDASCAGDGEEALALLEGRNFDLLITDLRMKGMDGLELMQAAFLKDPTMEVIFISAYSDVSSAVKAIKIGAFDYILKSFDNEDLLSAVKKAMERKKLRHRPADESVATTGYYFREPKMLQILSEIERFAKSCATVLLTGESGTGKEVLARIIHQQSGRRNRKFSIIDCSAIPAALLESEIFGHEKGAFTGASERKIGKFEAADKGTLFLDEIGELSLPMQTSFLRVLQEREFERVGGNNTVKVDVRIIAATNKDLEREVKEGRFREDLFYRLNICRISVPPLRQRREEIPVLAENFLKQFAGEYGKKLRFIGTDALLYLIEQPFRGNIRELKNLIEQAVILSDDGEEVLTLKTIARKPAGAEREDARIPGDGSSLEDYEKYLIENLLTRYEGNRNRIAKTLGIKRQTLYNKMKKYAIETRARPEKRAP